MQESAGLEKEEDGQRMSERLFCLAASSLPSCFAAVSLLCGRGRWLWRSSVQRRHVFAGTYSVQALRQIPVAELQEPVEMHGEEAGG